MRVWLRMENKIFRKTISVDHVKLGFDPKMVLHFYFHYKPFPGQTRKERDREREKRELPIHPIAPQHQRCQHLSTGIAIYLAPPSRSHHPRPIHPKPISLALLLPMTDLITLSSLPITQTNLSLSLHFWSLSLPPSLSLTEWWSLTNSVVLIFVFLSL